MEGGREGGREGGGREEGPIHRHTPYTQMQKLLRLNIRVVINENT